MIKIIIYYDCELVIKTNKQEFTVFDFVYTSYATMTIT